MNDVAASPALRAPLLATKLFIPPLRARLVPRPQLHAQLAAALDQPLTLVSAPAGFGKSTLVSMWVRSLDQPVGWLALDEGDNDLRRFLTYFVAALRQIDASLGGHVDEWLAMPGAILDAGRVEWMIAALVNDLSRYPHPCVLVLDDFHVIDRAAVLDVLRALLTHQPPQLHLVLLTREDPALPLARLRARGQLVEVRAQALRFSPAEIARFLHEVMEVPLDPAAIDALDSRIEGWIAGWQLAALSMQQRARPAELIAALRGNHPYILSYLTEEVLAQLSLPRQEFLLMTSVLARLTGPLCDAVTGRTGGDLMLAELERANLFVVPLDAEHRWYRYHHLFADLLHHQLQRAHPDLAPTLLARASAWYEAEGQPAEAVDYALAGRDYGRVVGLMETHARQIVLQGHAQTVESWLQRLPPDWQMAGPRANLAFAWSLLLRGRLDQIEPYLQRAEAAAARLEPEDPHAAVQIRAEIDGVWAGLGAVRGEGEQACVRARTAIAHAPPDDLYLQGMAYFALGTACNYAGQGDEAIAAYLKALPLCLATGNAVAAMLAVANLALLYVARGQLQRAGELCRQTMTAAEQRPGPPPPAITAVYLCYADLLAQWNDLDAAQTLAEQWLEVGWRGGHVATIAIGCVTCARIYQAQGDSARAAEVLEQAAAMRQYGMPAWVTAEVMVQQVRLALAQGDLAAAAHLLREHGQPGTAGQAVAERLQLAQVRLALAEGRAGVGHAPLARARSLASEVLASARAGERMGHGVEALVLRSLIHQAAGDLPAAQVDLAEAVELAADEGYVRLFVDEGAAMQTLLRQLAQDAGPAAACTRLLAAFPAASIPPDLPAATPAPTHPNLVEPLTEREREVLRLMAHGLTYQEVADRLIVSVNTVRFHVKSLYGKLGVDRRIAALERAAELGLL